MLAYLCKLKFLTLTSGIRHKKNKLFGILPFLGLLFLPLFVFMSVFPLFQAWSANEQLGSQTILQFVNTLMSGIFIMLFLTGIPVALHHLFLAEDNELFTALPIHKKTIFAFNLVQIALQNAAMFFAFALPVLVAMVAALHISVFSVGMLLFSFFFVLLPSICAACIAGLLAKFFPIQNSRSFSSALTAVAFLAVWGLLQFIRFSQFNPQTADFSWLAMENFYQFTQNFQFSFNPAVWQGKMLMTACSQQFFSSGMYLALQLIVSFAAFYLATALLVRIQPKQYNSKEPQTSHKIVLSHSLDAALFKQEFLTKSRDVRLMQSTLMLNAIMIVFSFTNGFNVEADEFYFSYLNIVVLGIIAVMTQARTSLAFDGLFFQYRLFSPLPLVKLVWHKILHAVFMISPGAVIGAVVITIKNHFPAYYGIIVLLVAFLLFVGVAALNLLLSSFKPLFNWRDFRELVGANSRYISMIFSFAWSAVGLVALLLIPKLIIAFIIYFLYVCFCVIFATHFAIQRLQKIQWIF